MFGWFEARRKVKTATYSVEIRKQTRECVVAVYQEGARKFAFDGEFVGKKWKQINLGVPPDLPPSDAPRVLENLCASLTKLGYEYVVFRTGKFQPVPEHEQQSAIAELRLLGMEPEVAPDQSTVKLKKIPGWKPPTTLDVKEQARRMMKAVATVRGKRSPIEILAKSPSAESDFL
jgi:hypothetical protein